MPLPPIPPDLSETEFRRVLTTYVVAAPSASGRRVLDAGCGTGHGTWLLSEHGARMILAVDLDPANARLVGQVSRERSGVHGAVMDVQVMGVSDASFDLVVCFEVIEHVAEPTRLLGELRRVAAPGALTLLSTPNRSVRLRPDQAPWNPDHLREYELTALRSQLVRFYRHVELLGIYGTGTLHQRYLDEWRPTLLRTMRTRARNAMPGQLRGTLRRLLVGRPSDARATAARTIPTPDARTWPFRVDAVSDRCLNFLAVCGDEPRRVQESAARLRARAA